MNDAPILSDDDPLSMPSMPTIHGGDPNTLGRIDHYDLLRKLGGGGFGVVYLARDTASGVEVAIKTLHPLIKRNAEEMDLLREKFALVSRLAHPNIATALVLHPVRDIHVWDDDARAELKLSPGDSVIVMRYAPGVTLSKWRRQFPDGVVPPDLALEIGRQVAAALDYAHGERIVHRDIKPGNIMVETLGGASRPGEPQSPGAAARRDASPHQIRARILDFGLAAEIRSSMSRVSTEQGDTSGTRPYMAPEQWLGKKQDGRTDQYALACVLYELLSGAPPFAGVFETGDPMIMMATVKSEAPDEIEDAAPAVNAAILRALAKAPKDRFPSCAAFVAALTSTTEYTEFTEGGNESTPHSPSAPNGEIRPVKSAIGDVCPTCSANNPKDARYCEACGTPLFRTCPKCGKEIASRVKFCSGCGTDMGGLPVMTTITLPGNVKLTMVPIHGKDYQMGKFPVTQAQWESVIGENPSYFKGAENPVERVSWEDCQAFLEKLNMLPAVKASKLVFRLPTEEEWEFAARAGATGDYCKLADGTEITAETLDEVAWFDDNSGGTTHPVGRKKPNAFGLYDMHGNVWEWTATSDFKDCIRRGGSWNYPVGLCDIRGKHSPSDRGNYLGFRLCASIRTD